MAVGHSTRLPAAVQKRIGKETGLRTGTVVSVDSYTSLTVTIGANNLPNMPYLNSYIPNVGDIVSVLFYGATWLVLGTPAAGGVGTLAYVTDVNNSAAIGTTRTTVLSTNPITFPNGFAFEVVYGWGVQASVLGGRGDFVAQQDSSSLGLVEFGTIIPGAATTNVTANGNGVFVNTSGGDITDIIDLSLLESGTAGTVTHVGTAARPRWLWVRFAPGNALDYPGAISLA